MEATTGIASTIRTKVQRSLRFLADGIQFVYCVDGQLVDNCTEEREEFNPDLGCLRHAITRAEFTDGDRWYLRPFSFSEVQTSGSKNVLGI